MGSAAQPLESLKVLAQSNLATHLLLAEDDLDLGRVLSQALKAGRAGIEWQRRTDYMPVT